MSRDLSMPYGFAIAMAKAVAKADDGTNPLILYLHEFLAENHKMFDKCLGLLPEGVFLESISGALDPLAVRSADS